MIRALKSFIFVTLILEAFSLQSWAGPSSSGGGGAIVCRGTRGEILSAKLLDLWEIELDYDIHRSSDSIPSQIQRALTRLKEFNPGLSEAIEKQIAIDEMRIKPVPAGREISPPNDADNNLIQTGCKLEGVAQYNDLQSILYFDQKIIPWMPLTDQAALRIHEALYRVLRDTEPTENSVKARMIVGYLFSDKPWDQTPTAGIDAENTQFCQDPQGSYQFLLSAKSSAPEVKITVLRFDSQWVFKQREFNFQHPVYAGIVSQLGKPYDTQFCEKTRELEPLTFLDWLILGYFFKPCELEPRHWTTIGLNGGQAQSFEIDYLYLKSNQDYFSPEIRTYMRLLYSQGTQGSTLIVGDGKVPFECRHYATSR